VLGTIESEELLLLTSPVRSIKNDVKVFERSFKASARQETLDRR
jgi:hypothetical protein